VKAKINPLRKLYWWWRVRTYELDPEKTTTFWEWLNAHDIELCKWTLVEGPEAGDVMGKTDHHHELVPLEMAEAEAVLERYLRNVRGIYGDPVAGD